MRIPAEVQISVQVAFRIREVVDEMRAGFQGLFGYICQHIPLGFASHAVPQRKQTAS